MSGGVHLWTVHKTIWMRKTHRLVPCGDETTNQLKLFHIISLLKCRVIILGNGDTGLFFFAGSGPDFQWLLSNACPPTTPYSVPLTTLYSASLADALLPSLVRKSQSGSHYHFCKASKLLILPQKKHCMLWEVAVLKIAWLPSHKGKGKKVISPS